MDIFVYTVVRAVICQFILSKSLSREKRAEKKGREGQEKERKQRKDRANTTAPASWSSTPIPGENERACRKHAYLIFKSRKQQFDAIFYAVFHENCGVSAKVRT